MYDLIQARHYSPKASRSIRWIVIHTMETMCKPRVARAIAGWFAGPNAPQASAHYCVDPGEVIQCVADHDIAWHCGSPGNAQTIGIELAGRAAMTATDWSQPNQQAMLRRAAALVAGLCAEHNIEPQRCDRSALRAGVGGLAGHNDVRLAWGGTTHTDPGPSFPWKSFVALVVEAMTPP